jgi:hypothetical protein
MDRRDFLKSCSVAAMAAGVPWAAAAPEAGRRGKYVLGADISWVPEDEAAGAIYLTRE